MSDSKQRVLSGKQQARGLRGAMAIVLAALLGAPAQAQNSPVRVFDRVPTVDELRSALPRAATRPAVEPTAAGAQAGAAADASAGPPRARGLVWNAPAQPAAPAAPVAAAPVEPAAAPRAEEAASPAVALPITFESGSSRLTREALAYLEPIAQLLKAEPTLRMQLEGHTDAIGQPRANLMLSWERAMSVMRALVERHGIEPQRLQPLGRGATEPLDGTSPDAAANRRVQLRPLG